MSKYELGKDIQKVLNLLEQCTSIQRTPEPQSTEAIVSVPHGTLLELVNQLHELIEIVRPLFGANDPLSPALDAFAQRYEIGSGIDTKWCCNYEDAIGGKHRFTLDALTRASATASCGLQVGTGRPYYVDKGKCR
jgi:hypothetical protein